MKNKRGISPLIATVLLIGFAVALAAVVMTWGGGFVRKTTESTETQAETTLMCANLNLDITGYSCEKGEISISNSKDFEIEEFTFRKLDKDGSMIGDPITKKGIVAYGMDTYNIGLTGVHKVHVISKLSSGIVCGDPPIEKVVNCATVVA